MAVLPQNLTNEYENNAGVVRADTEIIDGHEYAVLDVYCSTTLAMIGEFAQNNEYVKLIIKDSDIWGSREGDVVWRCNSIIIELNGCDFNIDADMEIFCQSLQIMNSVDGNNHNFHCGKDCYVHCQNFVLHSGAMQGRNTYITGYEAGISVNCYIYGGRVWGTVWFQGYMGNRFSFYMFGGYVGSVRAEMFTGNYNVEIKTAPCVSGDFTVRDEGSFCILAEKLTAADYYYAVSITDLASGVYNYAYGYAWELSVGELDKLVIPDDKTYYLWGRKADGWYEYLNLCYVDGAWRNAA